MKTYFDYSEKERSELSSERVNELLKYELMDQGVAVPDPPVRQPIVEPAITRHRKFEVRFKKPGRYGSVTTTGFCFDTVEQAEAFIALKPQPVDHDWSCGDDYAYFTEATETSVEMRPLCRYEDVNAIKAALAANSEAKKANEAADREFHKASDATRDATKHIWADWNRCCDLARGRAKIRATWLEYLDSCDLDATVAARFFFKLFSHEQAKDAFDWFGESVPGALCEAQPMREPVEV